MATPPSSTPRLTFHSDNTAGIAPEALAGLAAANQGSAPSYGDDPWSAQARTELRRIFEGECAVFFVFNGTAANALSLAQLCRGHQLIICHSSSHVDTDECGAPEFFTGGSKVVTAGGAHAKLEPAAVAAALHRGHGVHYPKPGALSLTQATELGTVYTPEEIRALSALAREHGLAVHMDGARFANAAAALAARGCSPADLTWRSGVDVLCLGGTKNGMLTTEAVVFFDQDRAREFEYKVKQGGQLASKARFAAAQWCAMLADGAWLRHAAHANTHARRLSAGVAAIPGLRLAAPTEANGVFVDLPPNVAAEMSRRGWHLEPFVGDRIHRFMCSWATTDADVDALLADLRAAAS